MGKRNSFNVCKDGMEKWNKKETMPKLIFDAVF